jgi:hypothetical protein
MGERMEEELMEDLAYEEAEGAAESYDEAEEEFEELDAAEDVDLGEEEEWEAGAEEEEWEAGAEEEELELGEEEWEAEGGEEEAELEDAMAYALGAEDTDEFFRRAFRAVRRVARGAARVARRVAPIVGRVARAAAPIARMIPHPYARAAAPVLGLLGRLRAEGATEEEAMDAAAELAAYDESAIPIVAGLAARSVLRGRAARLPLAARRRLVHGMGVAARMLTRRRGAGAIRALPRIVRSVRRTQAVRRTPVRVAPGIVRRTAARVARNPRLARRLARPIPGALRRVRRAVRLGGGLGLAGTAGFPRSLTFRGPVRIQISSAA